jgi:hypothetical protein
MAIYTISTCYRLGEWLGSGISVRDQSLIFPGHKQLKLTR